MKSCFIETKVSTLKATRMFSQSLALVLSMLRKVRFSVDLLIQCLVCADLIEKEVRLIEASW